MKIAIPIFNDRISPVFDWCSELLLVDIDSGRENGRRQIRLDGLNPLQRLQQLVDQGTGMLVCGGISQFLLSSIESRGIRVIPWVAGSVDEVLADLTAGGLPGPHLVMPGCRRQGGPGRGFGRGFGGKGGHAGGGGGAGRAGRGFGGKGGRAGGGGGAGRAGRGFGGKGGRAGKGGKAGQGRGWK